MITLTGVTGKLGRIVVEDVLARVPAAELVAVARDPGKAADLAARGVEVRRGDYEDPDSLRAAFAGSDVLLFVSGPDFSPGVRPRQHGNVVDAARAAGVGRVVYTSAIGAQRPDVPLLLDHNVTEGLLRDSGLVHTLLRNTFYTEAWVNPGLRDAVAAGELRSADGGQQVRSATIRDLALAASSALTGAGHEDAVYELRGPGWTFPELAELLTERSGHPVAYRAVPVEEMGPFGFVYAMIASGLFAEPADDLEKLLGRPATSLREALDAALDPA